MKKYIFFIFLWLIGCSDPTLLYQDYQVVSDEEWCMNHPVSFSFTLPETENCELTLSIRHTTDYEMANLWCFLNVCDSTGSIFRDTIDLKLAEADGKWLGEGNTIKTIERPLKHPLLLPQGNYTVNIEQGMRIKCLKGIKNVGVKIRKYTTIPS